MTYADNFQHADDVVLHLNGVVPGLADPLLQAKYAGFLSVAAVTVYELAIKEIFSEFARKKHKVFGYFVTKYFGRINGRIKIGSIKSDYVAKCGSKYFTRFERELDRSTRRYLMMHRRDIITSYNNLITWRNDFAHGGAFSSTKTYQEVVQAYEDGKEVLHCLDRCMVL